MVISGLNNESEVVVWGEPAVAPHANASRTKENQTLATPQRSFYSTRSNSPAIATTEGCVEEAEKNHPKRLQKTTTRGEEEGGKKDWVPKHSPAMKPSQCLRDF